MSWPIQLIFGEELTLANGTHLIALDVRDEIKAGTLAEALREIKAAGGFSVVPHPFKRGSGIFATEDEAEVRDARRLVGKFADAIEACNSKLHDRDNQRAFALARELDLAITAGADAHFGYDVGDAVLEVDDGSGANWRDLVRRRDGARVLMNRFVRRRKIDEHLMDTRINNLMPGVRRLVPKPLRTIMKRTLHRSVYQPRVRKRAFVLEPLDF